MLTIPARDLNQHTARVLDQITKSGETVQVTKNGVSRWRITPVPPEPVMSLETMIRAGLATRPSATLPLPSPIPVPSGRSVEDLLRELDGEDE